MVDDGVGDGGSLGVRSAATETSDSVSSDERVSLDRPELSYSALSLEKRAEIQTQSLTKLHLLLESAERENHSLRHKASELVRKCGMLRQAVSLSRAEERTLVEELDRRRLDAAAAAESRDSVLGAKYVIQSRLYDEQRTIDSEARKQFKRTLDELGYASSEHRRLQVVVDELRVRSESISGALVESKLALAQTAARADDLRSAIAQEHQRQREHQELYPDTFATTLRRTFKQRFARKSI